jgi:NodT family efflux transporter outer membrane factor (OMF) lipoprotein
MTPGFPKMASWAALAGSLLLAGCDLAPHYKAPATDSSGTFKEAVATESGASSGWKLAAPNDAELRGNWWEMYQDQQLNDLEERVVISNQTIAAAEANYRASHALADEARAALFPSVSAVPSIIRSRSSAGASSGGGAPSGAGGSGGNGATATVPTGGSSGTGPRTYFTLPVEASYELDLWGNVRNAYAQAARTAQASASQVATAILSTQSTLAQDYFSLRAADEQRRILDTTLVDYEASLHLVRTLYNNGLASEEDLAEADTQLDAAEAQATDLGIARGQFEHAIAVLIGVPPAKFSLAVRPFNAALPLIPVGVPSDLLERRPDVAGAERQVAAANAGIGVARAAFFPTLTLSGSAGFESTNLSQLFDWPNRFWSIGPSLAQVLFDGGLRKAATAQAWAAYDQAVANYRQSVLTAFQSVEDDLTSLRILSREVGQQHKAAAAAQHTVQLSVVRYQNGLDSYVNVITAQNSFLTNRLAELQVQLRQLTASVALINNLGGGWSTAQRGATESLSQKRPDQGNEAQSPPENAGPGVPNPAPLPDRSKRPEDLLKQNEQDMAPPNPH